MAQPATSPKIEELRLKLKADPKSRLFYQLAEELRRAGQFDESEKVLRTGLSAYPTYLAAWVSFGRVLREKNDQAGAVAALNTALQLDPGNVVAARLLADAYYALGEKVEAIKKYKLVHALLPSDETLQAQIALIERELEPPMSISAADETEEVPLPTASATPAVAPSDEESPFDRTIPPFAQAAQVFGEEARVAEETGDDEPMAFAHQESPFEEPVSGFGQAALEVEAPAGIQVAAAPVTAEVPAPGLEERSPIATPLLDASRQERGEDDVLYSISAEMPFESDDSTPAPATDAADTLTMADLYAKQGLLEEARHIYENILHRDPDNASVRAKLEDITPRVNPKIAKLEGWLARMSKREVGRV